MSLEIPSSKIQTVVSDLVGFLTIKISEALRIALIKPRNSSNKLLRLIKLETPISAEDKEQAGFRLINKKGVEFAMLHLITHCGKLNSITTKELYEPSRHVPTLRNQLSKRRESAFI